MTQLFNRVEAKKLRQSLRRNIPNAEILLWRKLRHRQLSGFKIRRQFSIGRFIVDFYCPQAKLAIEIDGDTHYADSQQILDKNRQAFIEMLGIKVLRFTNNEIYKEINEVLHAIHNELTNSTSPRPSPS